MIAQLAMFEDAGGYLAQNSRPRLVDTEIAILKVLNHPHVLQLYEVYFEPSTTAPWRLKDVSRFVVTYLETMGWSRISFGVTD